MDALISLKSAAKMRAWLGSAAEESRQVVREKHKLRGQTLGQVLDSQANAQQVRGDASKRAMSWPTATLYAIMEMDVADLVAVLQTLEVGRQIRARLGRRRLSKHHIVFTFGDELFSPTGGVREVLGGNYTFEQEEDRARIGSWLDMIGARQGDTLLHIALRLSGCADEDKAALVVELLGHGVDFETENEDRVLPSQLDQAVFRDAFFNGLPRWLEGRRAEQEEEVSLARAARRDVRMEERRRRQEVQQREERLAAAAAEHRRAGEEHARRQRLAHQRAVDRTMRRLERQEQRDASGMSTALKELIEQALPPPLQRFLFGEDPEELEAAREYEVAQREAAWNARHHARIQEEQAAHAAQVAARRAIEW